MRLSIVLTLILGLFPLTAAWAADAFIRISRPYVVYLLDGSPLKSSQLSSARQLALSPGKHQLVVRFESSYRKGSDVQLVSGEPLVFDFALKGGEQLTLAFKRPHSAREAHRFLAHQQVSLQHKDSGAVFPARVFVMPKKEGLQIGRDYQAELVAMGRAFGQPALQPQPPASSNTPSSAISTQNSGAIDNQALEMLKYWYSKADPETRRAFQYWVISQQ